MKHDNVTGHTPFLFAFFCIVGLLAPCGCRERRLSEAEAIAAFKKYVMSPIPTSVTDIRTDQPKDFGGYRYTFRFSIKRDDVVLLTNSGPFVRVWNVKYQNGDLWWQWSRDGLLGTGPITAMACYDHTQEPAWFRPGQWADPEAYAFRKEGDIVNTETFEKHSTGPTHMQILLYNEKEAEAYFVVTYWEK